LVVSAVALLAVFMWCWIKTKIGEKRMDDAKALLGLLEEEEHEERERSETLDTYIT
jgi:hypothetical protein